MKDINIYETKFLLPVVYLKYDKNFINNYNSINNFIKTTYGFSAAYKKYVVQRYELSNNDYYFESLKDNLIV